MKIINNLLFIVLFASSQLASADNDTEKALKICQEVSNVSFPTEDQINKNKLSFNPKCNALDYYYGIVCQVDFEKARLRAYEEMKNNDNMDGSIVLTMLYANGKEIKKNIPLAQKLACQNSFAPAELTARVLHLAQLNSNSYVNSFDFCNDITSGHMMGYCANITEEVVAIKRKLRLQHIINQWTTQQRFAFIKLQKAATEFTLKRSHIEIDLSGTARSMYSIQEEAIQKEDFIQSIEKLEKNKAPIYTHAQWHEEDIKLNSLYQLLQKNLSNNPVYRFTTITKSGIKETQRTWLTYRNSWVDFAKIRYPQYSSESIATWFTKKRNHMLDSLNKMLG